MAKYIANSSGTLTEVTPISTSAGAGDAAKIIQTDGSGRLDNSLMPVGIGADTATITASEALAAGDLVNIHESTGVKVRKADASSAGKEAHGFVLSAVASSAAATVYFEGTITGLSGLTGGQQYLSTSTAGRSQSAAPTTAGQVVQRVGVATSATTMNFEPQPGITLA